jgi:uroporphyrinogen-III synthase
MSIADTTSAADWPRAPENLRDRGRRPSGGIFADGNRTSMPPLDKPPLGGRRIALLESRMAPELAALVQRLGGIPYQVPAVREVAQPREAGRFIDALIAGHFSMVVFLTGAGVKALVEQAERIHSLEATLAALRLTRIVCRGPKPVAVLRQHGIPVLITAVEPYTSRQLIEGLQPIDLDGETVALVHYGETNSALAAALSARGAQLDDLLLYEWRMPDDVEPLRALVRELIDGRIDAIAFTTQIQCRHLFRVAGDMGLCQQLVEAMNTRAVVAAVGPICTEVLRFFGVTPIVVPGRPKLGPLVNSLSSYFQSSEPRSMALPASLPPAPAHARPAHG